MSGTIEFTDISKTYLLGDTSGSLVGFLARGTRKLLGRAVPDERAFEALREVSFRLEKGGSLGIIGPNGAGKTTILKLISGVTVPTRGSLCVDGRVSALLELGAGFHQELTGRENIYLKGAILGLSVRQIEERFDQIVDFSGLARFLDTPVKRYSSGMFVRLGFSVAAHADCEILLVDEVLAVGDSSFRGRCVERVESLLSRGTTIVLVSHNLYMVQSLCPNSIFLVDGRIRFQGATSDCIAAYQRWQAQSPERGESHSLGEGRVRISDVRFGSVDSDEEAAFHHDRSFWIDVDLQLEEALPDSRLVVRFVRADGVTAAMVRSDRYVPPLSLPRGNHRVRLEFSRLQLATGAYYLDVRMVGSIDGVPLDHTATGLFQARGLDPLGGRQTGVFVPDLHSLAVESPQRPGMAVKPMTYEKNSASGA